MSVSQFIQAPGSIFAANRTLADLGYDRIAYRDLIRLSESNTRKGNHDSNVVGFRALWAMASKGNADAAKAYIRAIERFLGSETFGEAEAQHLEDVAQFWRDETAVPFDLATARRPSHDEPVDMEDTAKDAGADVPSGHGATPGFKVLTAIGDNKSPEGKQMEMRFAAILDREIPRRGVTPAAGAFAEAILMDFPWATAAAAMIETSYDVARNTGSTRASTKPILIHGPHGSGKTSLAMNIGRLMGRHTVRILTAGTSDSAGLNALARGWATSRACGPAQAMLESVSCDPCIVIDEIDKGAGLHSNNGSVAGALMGMLDHPSAYHDSSLMANVDLSHCLFMATANDLGAVDEKLLDRFQLIRVPRPGVEHFDVLLRNLKREQALLLDVDAWVIPDLDDDEYRALRGYFKDSGQSLRRLASAYQVALKAAFARQKQFQM